MPSLYDISGEYAARLMQLEDCETEEQAAEIYDELDKLDADITLKAEAYAKIIRNSIADAEAYDAEIKRLQKHKKAKDTLAENLKNRLNLSMIVAGKKEIKTPIGKWSIQKNPPSVEILNSGDIPKELWISQEPKLDKKTILEYWRREGVSAPGTAVVQKDSLRFR